MLSTVAASIASLVGVAKLRLRTEPLIAGGRPPLTYRPRRYSGDDQSPAGTCTDMSSDAQNTSNEPPEDSETLGSSQPSNPALQKDPEEWVSGDDPMTPAQKSYLDTLARQAGEELPATLTKSEASEHIDRLRAAVGRGNSQS